MDWWLVPVILFVVGVIGVSLFPGFTYDDDCCCVCGSYYAEWELLDGKDPGDCCGGLYSALKIVWNKCNKGEHKGDLEWLESIRLKYNYTNVRSFLSINYNNPCPSSPKLKYLGTGYIVDYTPWSYDGPAYSITKICYNDSNHTFNNCGWNPYPYNKSSSTHVFRKKNGAWWNQFKEASLYDATVYPDKPEKVNNSWIEYQIKYDEYLLNGGVDVGDGY